MRKLFLILATILTSAMFALGQGQTTKIRSVTSLPASCSPGDGVQPADEVKLITGGNATLEICSSTNTWAAVAETTEFDARNFGCHLDGSTDDTSCINAMLTAASTNPTTFFFSGISAIASNESFPATVNLRFAAGGGLKPSTSVTLTIAGDIVGTAKQQIFYNALASQGTISFSGNKTVYTFYPVWWGPHANNSSTDYGPLQAATEAADSNTSGAAGGAILDLGIGTYNIGTNEWQIASPTNVQHHLSIVGAGPNATIINSGATSTNCAVYMALEKYVVIRGGFAITQTGSVAGYGLCLTGDAGTGTQTNGDSFQNITISGFTHGVDTQAGLGTSSELTFEGLVLNGNTAGFYCNNFNALNFSFINLQMNNNTTGISKLSSCNISVLGGDAESNTVAFSSNSSVDSPSVLNGYRIALGGNNEALVCSGNFDYWILNGVVVTVATTSGSNTAISMSQGCRVKITDSKIASQISWNPGNVGFFSMENSCIVDPSNTYTLANQVTLMGPGFRIPTLPGQDGNLFLVKNVQNATTNCDDNTTGFFPNVEGWIRIINNVGYAISNEPHTLQIGSGNITVAGEDHDVQCTTTCTVTFDPCVFGGSGCSTIITGKAVSFGSSKFCVYNAPGVATVITLAALGSSARYGKTDQSGYGTAGTGTAVSGGANGDSICIESIDATHFQVLPNQFHGTWTMN